MIRIVLAIVFLSSGLSKLIDPTSFSVIIEAYGLIQESWVMPVAIALPLLEVVGSLGLLLDIRGSLATISGMLVLFLVILGYGVWMGLDIDCGCFGPEDPEAEAFHSLRPAIYRDVVMMIAIAYLYYWRYCKSAKTIRLRYVFTNYLKKEV